MNAASSVARAAVLLTLALSSPALAGTASKTAPAPAPANAGEAKPDPVCASYGAGFTRLAGSSTCLKISGDLQVDSYGQSSSGAGNPGALQPALRSK